MTTLTGVISYPIPPYSNLPIEAQFFLPSRFVISNVTLGNTTIVTTSIPHNYVVSQQVRLLIPVGFGCTQLNNAFGYVISIPSSTQVEININSTGANAYIAATSNQSPQIIAIGDVNTGPTNTGRTNNQTFISGSFINISPQ